MFRTEILVSGCGIPGSIYLLTLQQVVQSPQVLKRTPSSSEINPLQLIYQDSQALLVISQSRIEIYQQPNLDTPYELA